MTLHAVKSLRELRPGGRVGRVRVVGRRLRLLRGEIGREIVHVSIAEVYRHRRHLRVLAVALAKLKQLGGDELCRLAGERGYDWISRIARRPVARDADLRLL